MGGIVGEVARAIWDALVQEVMPVPTGSWWRKGVERGGRRRKMMEAEEGWKKKKEEERTSGDGRHQVQFR